MRLCTFEILSVSNLCCTHSVSNTNSYAEEYNNPPLKQVSNTSMNVFIVTEVRKLTPNKNKLNVGNKYS